MIELITKSRMAAHNGCQRLHKLLYVDGYRAIYARDAADFGNMFHAALDAWWMAVGTNGWSGDPVEYAIAAMGEWRRENPRHALDRGQIAKAEILAKAYDARWSESLVSEYELLAVEQEFSAPIPGMRGVRVGGKIDKLLRRRSDGAVGFVEHKTTSADVSPESSYWTQLRMNTQVSVYYLGASALGHDPQFCLYDVVSRPKERPLKATPIDARKYTKEGKLYASQRDRDETDEEFEARLAEKILADPDAYLARATVARLDSQLEAALDDLRQTAAQIRTVARTGVAPRNPDHCFHWGRACEFFDVCSGVAELDDTTRFEKLDNVHPELELVTIKNPKEKGRKTNATDSTGADDERQITIADLHSAEASGGEGASSDAAPAAE